MKKLLITLALITVNATHPNFFHGLKRDIEAVAKAAPKIKSDIKVGRKTIQQSENAFKAQTSTVGKKQPTKAVTQAKKK